MKLNARVVAAEFSAVDVGDKRLTERVQITAEAIAANPSASFPQVMSSAELEGHYRFVNNERVSFQAVLASHVAATTERMRGHERVIVAHDTTDIRFSDEVRRGGLALMDNGGQGFFLHLSLAVTSSRLALGVLAAEPWTLKDRVVDDYRARWCIEEYFKALKTGCAYEERQNETKDALLNTLGVLIPIAWSLLNLRDLSRHPTLKLRPATDLFTPLQLDLLRMYGSKALPRRPTVVDAVLALARHLGGHLPGNGPPGWQVLGRAYQNLLMAEVGWTLALKHRGKAPE